MLAIIVSTWWVAGMRVALEAGIPWLLLLTVLYFAWGRQHSKAAGCDWCSVQTLATPISLVTVLPPPRVYTGARRTLLHREAL